MRMHEILEYLFAGSPFRITFSVLCIPVNDTNVNSMEMCCYLMVALQLRYRRMSTQSVVIRRFLKYVLKCGKMDAARKQILDIFTPLRDQKSFAAFHLQIYFAEAGKSSEFNFFKNNLSE